MAIFVGTLEMETMECCVCGVTFAMPKEMMDKYTENHKSFYCPSGHSQYFPSESKAERLERLLAHERNCCISAREEANRLERSLRAVKGHLTRKKKAVGEDD
jgi:hypothetical protein